MHFRRRADQALPDRKPQSHAGNDDRRCENGNENHRRAAFQQENENRQNQIEMRFDAQ